MVKRNKKKNGKELNLQYCSVILRQIFDQKHNKF